MDRTMSSPAAGGILIIDDEVQIRRFLRISLQTEGYQVNEAATGGDGLALAETSQPALIVLDLGLPDIDGQDVLGGIRAFSNVPVIILSVRDDEGEKVRALDLGANDYVTKPFGVQEFLARVRRHLGHVNDAGVIRNEYDDGHLRFDLARHQVELAGEPIKLTPKEFNVLGILIRNADRVITQQQLLRQVWGESHQHDSHYLRILIGRLRHKLGDDPVAPTYLHTEPGVGYRFETRVS
ncbi:DNA-binding response regulator KdpE [Alloalcanivorax xenomutans]|nr:response regulator transcription factor [Alcanivorax sp.]PHS71907.1 MAG: DNA-binding response regulator [Alcanivorax sp.]CUR47050.1 DNA-binding response regulator KdpE [Alloalcanivorax xenomutans]